MTITTLISEMIDRVNRTPREREMLHDLNVLMMHHNTTLEEAKTYFKRMLAIISYCSI